MLATSFIENRIQPFFALNLYQFELNLKKNCISSPDKYSLAMLLSFATIYFKKYFTTKIVNENEQQSWKYNNNNDYLIGSR